MVQKTKTTYVSPLTHIIEVKMEGIIATSGDMGINGFSDDPDEIDAP